MFYYYFYFDDRILFEESFETEMEIKYYFYLCAWNGFRETFIFYKDVRGKDFIKELLISLTTSISYFKISIKILYKKYLKEELLFQLYNKVYNVL